MAYLFNGLYSLPIQHLVVRAPGGAERKVEIAAKEHQQKRVLDLTSGDGDIWQLVRDEENSEHSDRFARQSRGGTLCAGSPAGTSGHRAGRSQFG
jgi:hypothetical protein